MTAKELKDKIKEMPDDATVYIQGDAPGVYAEITGFYKEVNDIVLLRGKEYWMASGFQDNSK